MYAIIDIGSNTIRLSVYDYTDGHIDSLFHKKVTAGLAGYVEDGYLTQKGISKAIEVIGSFVTLVRNLNIANLYAFATASLRNVKNSKDAVQTIISAVNLPIDIISGKEEATLDFIGATHKLKVSNGVLLDIGGGSTEVVIFASKEIKKAVSIPIGSLNSFSNHVKEIFPTEKEARQIRKTAIECLEASIARPETPTSTICGVGGTIRNALKLDREIFDLPSNRSELETAHVKKILKFLMSGNKSVLKTVLQTVPDRVHTITPGLIILNTAAEYFSSCEIAVSSFGVREGYLFKKVIKEG